jgi:flavin-dependent thymidylate synthase
VKVTLLYATPMAMELLIFTKNTRLNMSPEGLKEIASWPQEQKLKELEYMSKTIPSSWEFVDVIFSIEQVTRAFTHQFVRTRTASFAQQSMRVNNMESFGYSTGNSIFSKVVKGRYDATMDYIQHSYDELIAMGVSPEDARGILPTNIHTNIVAKFNLRNFVELVKKRSSGRVQNEYGEVIKLMVEKVLLAWPWASLFLEDKKTEALERLTIALKERMQWEIDTFGVTMNNTHSWTLLKDLDLLRDTN